MSRRAPSSHTWLCIGLSLVIAWVAACYDETALEGAECLTDADCWQTQTCVKTPTQAALGIGGTCQAEGSDCAVGKQNGCECSTDPGQDACSATKLRPSNLDSRDDCLCCDCRGVEDAEIAVDSKNQCLCCPPDKGEGGSRELFVGIEDDACKYCPDVCESGVPTFDCQCPQDETGTTGG